MAVRQAGAWLPAAWGTGPAGRLLPTNGLAVEASFEAAWEK